MSRRLSVSNVLSGSTSQPKMPCPEDRVGWIYGGTDLIWLMGLKRKWKMRLSLRRERLAIMGRNVERSIAGYRAGARWEGVAAMYPSIHLSTALTSLISLKHHPGQRIGAASCTEDSAGARHESYSSSTLGPGASKYPGLEHSLPPPVFAPAAPVPNRSSPVPTRRAARRRYFALPRSGRLRLALPGTSPVVLCIGYQGTFVLCLGEPMYLEAGRAFGDRGPLTVPDLLASVESGSLPCLCRIRNTWQRDLPVVPALRNGPF